MKKWFFILALLFTIGITTILLTQEIKHPTIEEQQVIQKHNKAMVWTETQTYFLDLKSYDYFYLGQNLRYTLVTTDNKSYEVDTTHVIFYKE